MSEWCGYCLRERDFVITVLASRVGTPSRAQTSLQHAWRDSHRIPNPIYSYICLFVHSYTTHSKYHLNPSGDGPIINENADPGES